MMHSLLILFASLSTLIVARPLLQPETSSLDSAHIGICNSSGILTFDKETPPPESGVWGGGRPQDGVLKSGPTQSLTGIYHGPDFCPFWINSGCVVCQDASFISININAIHLAVVTVTGAVDLWRNTPYYVGNALTPNPPTAAQQLQRDYIRMQVAEMKTLHLFGRRSQREALP